MMVFRHNRPNYILLFLGSVFCKVCTFTCGDPLVHVRIGMGLVHSNIPCVSTSGHVVNLWGRVREGRRTRKRGRRKKEEEDEEDGWGWGWGEGRRKKSKTRRGGMVSHEWRASAMRAMVVRATSCGYESDNATCAAHEYEELWNYN